MNDAEVHFQLMRENFLFFVHRVFLHLNPGREYKYNWHLEAIAYHLQMVTDGKIRRLIVNLPPRYLKSQIISVAFTAFMLGHRPSMRIYGISYNMDLTSRHANDVRSVMTSAWYRRVFPGTRIIRVADADIYTNERGYRMGTSVGSSLTGFGGDLFILDDVQKPLDAWSEASRNTLHNWVSTTLMPRQEGKSEAAIILVMQRVHMNDLTAHLLEQTGRWTHLNLPAIADEDMRVPIGFQNGKTRYYGRKQGFPLHKTYEPLSTLAEIRADIGEADFSAQYLQSPVPVGGAMIRRETFRYVEAAPIRDRKVRIVQSWDTAGKTGPQNDFSVCTTWMFIGQQKYLIDIEHGKFEYSELLAKAVELAQRFKPTSILVEDASSGIALAQDLRKLGRFVVRAVPVEHNKEARVYLQQAKFDAGHVIFVKGIRNLALAEHQLLSFPQVKHDDVVDSIMQALAFDKPGYDVTMRWVRD